jgi:hypothetical protein
MAGTFVLIGLVIAADAVLGYNLAMYRARRFMERDALSAVERRGVRDALRHWGVITALASLVGSFLGARLGPGFAHGLLMVAGASVLIGLPVTYACGVAASRSAGKLLREGPKR